MLRVTTGRQFWSAGLALTFLVLYFNSATCRGHTFYVLKETREIESANLMDELSKPLEPINQVTGTKVSVGKQVALILAKAKHKREKKVILGKFRVKDLLRLRKVRIEDCHVDVLAKRKQFCEDNFAGKHVNLYLYCTKMNTNLLDWCNYEIDKLIKITLNKISKVKVAEKLRDTIKKVAKSGDKKLKAVNEADNVAPNEVFNLVQAKTDDSFKAEVESVCGLLEKALNSNFDIRLKDERIDFKMDHWVDFLRYCQVAIKLSPPVDNAAPSARDQDKEEEEEGDESVSSDDDEDEFDEDNDLDGELDGERSNQEIYIPEQHKELP